MPPSHGERRSSLRRDFVESAATHHHVVDVGARNQIDERDEAVRRNDREMSLGIERHAAPIRAADVAGKDYRGNE
jgi:hypothetical protein